MSDLAPLDILPLGTPVSSNGHVNGNGQAQQVEESSSPAKHFIPKPQTREQYQLLLLVSINNICGTTGADCFI